jgi:hypothetical protein
MPIPGKMVKRDYGSERDDKLFCTSGTSGRLRQIGALCALL